MKLYLLDLLFSDESTFYLDNPVGAWWVKSNLKNYINAKNKERKIMARPAIISRGKSSLNCMKKYEYPKWFKSIRRGNRERRKNSEIFHEMSYFFKLEMQDIIGQLKHLNFIIKIIFTSVFINIDNYNQ